MYKPFAVDSRIVGPNLVPGPLCTELARSWEQDQGFEGFADGVPHTEGGRLRDHIRDQVRKSLREGHCTTSTSSWLFGRLTASLHPDHARPAERRALRLLITQSEHETRAELAAHLDQIEGELDEPELLAAVRPACTGPLGRIIDAVDSYERFATLADVAFRTLCAISHAMGTQPLTPVHAAGHEVIVRCADELPERYRRAADCMAAIGSASGLEERLGEFAIRRSPTELFELLLAHHERVQDAKAPNGKRPWFEPFRDGWVVRGPYGTAEQPELGPGFIHPVRAAALRRFLADTVV